MATRNAIAIGKLAEWGKRFEKVASPQQKGALTKEMSKATLAFIAEGFRKESTPTGQKWRPKKRPNGQQILVETGKMRKGFTAKVGLGKFEIANTQPYTGIHQAKNRGRSTAPRRQMWPDPGKLPAKYLRTYTSIFQKRTFNILMGRKSR